MELLGTQGRNDRAHARARIVLVWLALASLSAACGKTTEEAAAPGGSAAGAAGTGPAAAAGAATQGDVALPLSNTREAFKEPEAPPGLPSTLAEVTVSADGIRCGGRTVAVIRTEADGRRVLEKAARTGGSESSFLPDLRACLVAHSLDLSEIERRTGRAFQDKGWMLLEADRATPMRIVEDVLYTSTEADHDRILLLLRTRPADAAGRPDVSALGTTTLLDAGGIDPYGCCGGASQEELRSGGVRLGLTIGVSRDAVTLEVDPGIADAVLPPGSADVTGRRVVLPNVTMTVDEVAAKRAECEPPGDPEEFNDCDYWAFLAHFLRECPGGTTSPGTIPDLRSFHLRLRDIQDRLRTGWPADGRPSGSHGVTFRIDDDVPYCTFVALADFARFRSPGYDWNADVEFSNAVAKGVRQGLPDPMLDPSSWNEAMTEQLLFPIVRFVRAQQP